MAAKIIELVDLTRKYGSHTVVDKLSLRINKGEVFGLLGPNGAGKSTSILMMMGLTEPDSGSVRVCGIDPTRDPIAVKKRVGYLPEEVGFYDEYSGLDNLLYTARLNGLQVGAAKEKAAALLNKVGLADSATKKTGKYSRGMRQRLGLADVLIKDPEVIILDEPTLGIDPAGVRDFLDLIVQLSKEESITVLFSSHHLYQVQQVCHRVGLFVQGKLLAIGNINALSKKLFANKAYTIEAGIATARSRTGLDKVLRKIDGVLAVTRKEKLYRIECAHDVTPAIARTVIEHGADLNYLNKKEYGLDDIYYRYFEGSTDHE